MLPASGISKSAYICTDGTAYCQENLRALALDGISIRERHGTGHALPGYDPTVTTGISRRKTPFHPGPSTTR